MFHRRDSSLLACTLAVLWLLGAAFQAGKFEGSGLARATESRGVALSQRNNDYGADIVNFQDLAKDGLSWIPAYGDQTLTLIVLFRNEYELLSRSLASWNKGGLLDLVDELIIFCYGREERHHGSRWSELKLLWANWNLQPRVISIYKGVQEMTAMRWSVGNATSRYVLAVNPGFRFTHSREDAAAQIDDAKKMLSRDAAHVVRFRSRKKYGPDFFKMSFMGREQRMPNAFPPFMCNAYTWLEDPVSDWPQYFWRCSGHSSWSCSRSRDCAWVSDPQMFGREWFLRTLYRPLQGLEGHEYLMNRDVSFTLTFGSFWRDRGIVVALSDGLFTGGPDNTSLLTEDGTNDAEMRCYRYPDVRAEVRQLMGQWKQPIAVTETFEVTNSLLPDALVPATVANWYHPARNMADDLAKVSYEVARALADEPRTPLRAPDSINSGVTLVTGLWQLDQPNRTWEYLLDYFRKSFLDKMQPKVVFLPESVIPMVKQAFDPLTFVIPFTIQDLQRMIGVANAARIEELRRGDLWSGPMATSRPVTVQDYSIVTMSKMLLLAHAARLNPFGTPHVLWTDAWHYCDNQPCNFAETRLGPLYEHMSGTLFAAYALEDVEHASVGLTTAKLNGFLGRTVDAGSHVRVVQSGIFGGSIDAVIAAEKLYLVVLEATLKSECLPRDETLLSILQYRYPGLFRLLSQEEFCKSGTNCRYRSLGVCAAFEWIQGRRPIDPGYFFTGIQSSD